jgi:hypothetical protein
MMSQPCQVVQAYDRALIKELSADDAAALEARLETAFRLMKDRDGALKAYERSASSSTAISRRNSSSGWRCGGSMPRRS